MNPFEKLSTVAKVVSSFDSPLTRLTNQQQIIVGQMERVSVVSRMIAFDGLPAVAKSSPIAGMYALGSLTKAASTIAGKIDGFATARAFDVPSKMQATVLSKTLMGMNSAISLGGQDLMPNHHAHLKQLGKAGILPFLAIVPPATMTAINNMPSYQAKLIALGFDLGSKYSVLGSPLSVIRGIYPDTLQSTLKTLSRNINKRAFEITTKAVVERQWETIEELDELLNGTIALTEAVVDSENFVEDEGNQFVEYFQSILKLLRHHLKFDKSLIHNVLTFIGYIMAFHQYGDFIKPKPELATKKDWQAVKQDLQHIKLTLAKQSHRSTVIHKCTVYLKPNSKSTKLAKLAVGAEVEVLDTNSRWVHISFHDELDNYPITGWILKKYLHKIANKNPQ